MENFTSKHLICRTRLVQISVYLLLFFSLFQSKYLAAQHFKIGLAAGATLCQIEGDRLNGFNKKGFEFGIVGLYKLNKNSFLYVSPSLSKFGSERSYDENLIISRDHMASLNAYDINVLWAYMINFGNKKIENGIKYKTHFGIKMHNLIAADTKVTRLNKIVSEDEGLNFEDFRHVFPSANLGIGVYLMKNMTFDFRFDLAVLNVLKPNHPNFDKIIPYQIGINLIYII